MDYDRLPTERDSHSASTPYSPYKEYYPDTRRFQASPPKTSSANDAFDRPPRPRSRTSSSNSKPGADPSCRPQPVFDAVNGAFDNSSTANQLPQEMIEQITEQVRSQVINSLRAEGLASPIHQQPLPTHMQSMPVGAPQPAKSASAMPPPANGPLREEPALGSRTQPSRHASPNRQRTDSVAQTSPTKLTRHNSVATSNRTEPAVNGSYFDINPASKSEAKEVKPDRKLEKEDIGSRFGDRVFTDIPRRPTLPSADGETEPTIVEKIWQPLFDSHGEPTLRLSQFLRGIALHLIEAYEPKNSLVITPSKMRRFYEETKLAEETYPWSTIFTLANVTIGKIYRDLKLSHFLVQDKVSNVPSIPALTPEGFQRWMTLQIQAHPQAEFDRLATVAADMPINNADDTKERFPKELSRRLLPKYDDLKTRQYCSAALRADGQVTIPNHTSFPPPPPPGPATQPTSFEDKSYPERQRAPYSGRTSKSTVDSQPSTEDDSDHDAPSRASVSLPIERERKPYIAREGSGKIYEKENGWKYRPESNISKHRSSSAFLERENEQISDGSRTSDNTAMSEPPRRNSKVSRNSKPRTRSPLRDGFTKSDPSVADIPDSYFRSNLHSERDDEHTRRRTDRERDRDLRDVRSRDDREERRPERRSTEDRERREREERERDARERDARARDEYLRRREEDEARFARYDGEPLATARRGSRPTLDTGVSYETAYGHHPLGTGERRYG